MYFIYTLRFFEQKLSSKTKKLKFYLYSNNIGTAGYLKLCQTASLNFNIHWR